MHRGRLCLPSFGNYFLHLTVLFLLYFSVLLFTHILIDKREAK